MSETGRRPVNDVIRVRQCAVSRIVDIQRRRRCTSTTIYSPHATTPFLGFATPPATSPFRDLATSPPLPASRAPSPPPDRFISLTSSPTPP
ncbi:MAG: hypothetical protein HDS99_04820 [Bacteroidales bacterium]|nr:hypothetical protein [Bacteroidales bacterium]